MKQIQLADKQGLIISKPLFELNEKNLICQERNTNLVPIGMYIESQKFSLEWQNDRDKDDFLINKNDLLNCSDTFTKTVGCCGPDGEYMNIASNNNIPLGYEFGDCYMPHCIRIPKAFVKVIETKVEKIPLMLVAIIMENNQMKIVERMIADNFDQIVEFNVLIEQKLKWQYDDETEVQNTLNTLNNLQIFEYKQIKYNFL